jgi:hypothetical protein
MDQDRTADFVGRSRSSGKRRTRPSRAILAWWLRTHLGRRQPTSCAASNASSPGRDRQPGTRRRALTPSAGVSCALRARRRSPTRAVSLAVPEQRLPWISESWQASWRQVLSVPPISPGSLPSVRAHCWRAPFERCRSFPTCCWSTPRGAITHAAPVSHFILARSSSGRRLASPTDPCWLVENGRQRSQAHAAHWCSAKRRSAAGCGHVSARVHWLCTRPGGPTSTLPAPPCSPSCIARERLSPCGRHAASRDALGRASRQRRSLGSSPGQSMGLRTFPNAGASVW